MSNRFVLVPRESIDPTIEGCHFGGECFVIARSPRAVLFWRTGHTWSNNGFAKYAGPALILLPDRRPRAGGWLNYRRLVEDRRISFALLEGVFPAICEAFDIEPKRLELFKATIRNRGEGRRTLLIDGGGPALMPSRKLGQAAYDRWALQPERGFQVKGGL